MNKWKRNQPTAMDAMPAALIQQRISQLVKEFDTADEAARYAKGYEMAMSVYDTDTFRPLEELPYHRMCDEPEVFSMLKEYLPAYYYGCSDEKYSPRNNYRVFKVNLLCFEGKNPVIAVRDDCNCQEMYQLQAGLLKCDDKSAADKYPGWEFYMIDPSTADGHYAVFTNELEKEFAVEIAHLVEDGSLHRIYHLFY